MPKLDSKIAETVEKAENGSALIEEGTYEMVLLSVEANGRDGKPLVGKAGPYWSWTFAFAEDAERYAKRRVWAITSLSADAAWKLKEHFDAFGVGADADTDDLIGRKCLVQIGSRLITQGEKAGETMNTIKKVLPLDGVSAPAGGKGAEAGKAKKDLF
jgi:hypothetical protein